MPFALYGDSYGQLAAQQQAYDQFYNAASQANRAAAMHAADREAELAFRAREMAQRDIANAAQVDESRFRFGVEQALRAQAREDQLAAQRAQIAERRFQFGKQLEQDKARLDLEKAKMAQTQDDSSDEAAQLYSEQLGRLREGADQAAAARASAAGEIRRVADTAARVGLEWAPGAKAFTPRMGVVPNVQDTSRFTNAYKEALKQAAAAMKSEQSAKTAFERALGGFETRGLRGGYTVDREGNRIITKSGREFSFGPDLAPAPSTPTPRYRIGNDGRLQTVSAPELPERE